MYVDTGINAIYARKTTISNRINSLILANHVLPAVPTNTSDSPLEPAIADLVRHGGGGGGGGRQSVFAARVRS